MRNIAEPAFDRIGEYAGRYQLHLTVRKLHRNLYGAGAGKALTGAGILNQIMDQQPVLPFDKIGTNGNALTEASGLRVTQLQIDHCHA